MSETTSKPWGFSLLGGKKGTHTLVVFFPILILAVLIHLGGWWRESVKDQQARPSIALKSFLRDLRQFVRDEKKMPADLRELEVKIWNKGNADQTSRLTLGKKILVADNYEYVFYSGNVNGISVAFVWAIPLGKFRDEFETVLLVVSATGEDTWRGPALNEQQIDFVQEKGFNPSYPAMAQLNMSKDVIKPQTNPEKKRFGLF